MVESKLTEHGLMENVRRKVVTYGQTINLGCFRIEFIRTNTDAALSVVKKFLRAAWKLCLGR